MASSRASLLTALCIAGASVCLLSSSETFENVALSILRVHPLLGDLLPPTAKDKQRKLLETSSDSIVSIRVFGPAVEDEDNSQRIRNGASFTWYTPQQQRQYLQDHGKECWPPEDEAGNNLLVQRFDELESFPFLQAELWKFCMFYSDEGNVFLDRSQVVPLVLWQELWENSQKNHNDQSTALLMSLPSDMATSAASWMHSSFLRLDAEYSKTFSQNILRLLLETEGILLTSNPLYTYQAMAQHVQNEQPTHLWKAKCQVPASHNPADHVLVQRQNTKKIKSKSKRNSRRLEPEIPPEFYRLPTFGWHCTSPGGYCCQVWKGEAEGMPTLLVKHPFGTTGGLTARTPASTAVTITQPKRIQYPANPVPYWSIITAVPNENSVAVSKLESPNFFDILLQNNCLPTSPECRACLKRYTSTTGCDDQCKQECPCYCKVLCQIRPPPKRVQSVWYVSPPLYNLPAPLPPRLIPRLVHQTWYETLTPEKYPNMSRLQQSWKQSGWEHTFYDDETAAKFLEEHFPPAVLEAYNVIQPGAFKADLFRYCCLLIQGGVYADMDVLLETNLEEAIAPDVGFLTPIDEPGIKVGQQACLWNGLMAVAPGHPFVAKTIELVVNNIRNRFTSVDYDDMLCPDPVLSASHLWDILFTTGPCILGTAMNLVLQRHPQTGFTPGEIDIWGVGSDSKDGSSTRKTKPPPLVEPDDPRLAIPGRSIILRQNKNDMGAHRFTLEERNLILCSTDMPDYDDRPKKPHYAESGRQTSLYGTTNLYSDFISANEEIRVVVVGNPSNFTI